MQLPTVSACRRLANPLRLAVGKCKGTVAESNCQDAISLFFTRNIGKIVGGTSYIYADISQLCLHRAPPESHFPRSALVILKIIFLEVV